MTTERLNVLFLRLASYFGSAFAHPENVMMPVLAARGRPDEEMRASAAELLDKVGLARWRDKKTSELSGGQQQRVAVARSLAMKPALVLADEPTGNLDADTAEQVLELLLDSVTRAGATLLMATHSQPVARRADRMLRVEGGKLVEAMAPR